MMRKAIVIEVICDSNSYSAWFSQCSTNREDLSNLIAAVITPWNDVAWVRMALKLATSFFDHFDERIRKRKSLEIVTEYVWANL